MKKRQNYKSENEFLKSKAPKFDKKCCFVYKCAEFISKKECGVVKVNFLPNYFMGKFILKKIKCAKVRLIDLNQICNAFSKNFQKLSIKVTYLATGTMIKGASGYFSTE